MANFTAKVPVESEKIQYLHDRSNRPHGPKKSIRDYAASFAPLILGVLFAMGLEALAFTTRASWGGQRDWVVPTTTPLWVAGGMMLAATTWRQKLEYAMPAYGFIAIGLVFTTLNIVRGIDTTGSDHLRDFYSIAAGVVYGCGIAAAVIGWAVLEVRDPIQAPQPEM